MKALTKFLKNSSTVSKRRKSRRSSTKSVVPQVQRTPQRLGIGTTEARVTRVIQVTANSTTTYSLLSNAFESYEFSRQAEDYSFFRVKCINVIQHPVNVVDVDGQVWMYMDWLNDDNLSLTTLGTCDNAKLLSYNLVKPLIYTFLPPNARLRYSTTENDLTSADLPLNYREWIPAAQMLARPAPGWLQFMNVGNKPITVTVDVVLLFKGSKAYDSAHLRIEMQKMKKHIKVKPSLGLPMVKEAIEDEEEDEKVEFFDIKEDKKKKKKRELP